MEDSFQIDDMPMSELLEGMPEKVSTGTVVQARVIGPSPEGVLVDIGVKTEGLIPQAELADFGANLPFKVGDTIPVLVRQKGGHEGPTRVSWRAARERTAWDHLMQAFKDQTPVEAVIRRKVKGGYAVDVGVDAFLPGSQLDLRPVSDPAPWLGKSVQVLITEADRAKSNVVVSRRKFVEQERARQREITLAHLAEGQVCPGVVTSLTKFGAFVDIGGVEGLLHISDVSWHRTEKVESVLKVGQTCEVKVLKIDRATQRISLGLKQLQPRPWEGVEQKYPVGSEVHGRVTSLTTFGAFVQLEPGVEGLVHSTEFSWKDRMAKPSDFVKPQQNITVKVLAVDAAKEKISLSLKRMEPSPYDRVRAAYPKGTRVQGTVTHLAPFGAFVMLPEGVEGLVHVSDMSWTKRVKSPGDCVAVGQTVEVVVLDVLPDQEKIVLSLKHREPDPFRSLKLNQAVTGHVREVNDHLLVVELSNGLEATVRRGEWADPGDGPTSVVKIGEEISAKVTRLDAKDRKIELSIRRFDREQERELLSRYAGHKQQPLKLGDVLVDPEAFDSE